MARLSEDALIARYLAPLAKDPGALALTDDAAHLSAPVGEELIITVDGLVAGVHFFADDPPDLIARKALRTNLSDLAAKGARPRAYLLTLSLPEAWSEEWLAGFASGLQQDQDAYGISLLGGDTTRALGPLTISITALGLVPKGQMVKRSGARPGELVFVTGTIGDSALGCRLRLSPNSFPPLAADERAHLLNRYLLPQPRCAFAEVLCRHASSAMDISDGLVGDFAKLCRVSQVSAEIDARTIPLSRAAKSACGQQSALFETALTGGDDYEILFTAAPQHKEALLAGAQDAQMTISEIGYVTSGTGPPIFKDGDAILQFTHGSYSHF